MQSTEVLNVLSNTKPLLSFVKTAEGVPVKFLKNADLPISFEPAHVEKEIVAHSVSKLSEMPETVRPALAKAMFEMCMQSFEDCDCDFDTPQAQLDWEAENGGTFDNPKVPSSPEEIWQLVKFSEINVSQRLHGPHSGKLLTSLRGTTAWDGEHGLALFFDTEGHFVEAGDLNS